MNEIHLRRGQQQAAERVSDENPFPVILGQTTPLPRVAGERITRLVPIPGIGAATAYADSDAFGGRIHLPNLFRPAVHSGVIVGAFFLDLDNEGIQVDVALFAAQFTATADNSAFAVSAADMLLLRGVVSISQFYAWSGNRFGQDAGTNLHIVSASQDLWAQCIIRGAANIAATAMPYLGITVEPD